MKIGRWVVDAHIHCGKRDAAKKDSRIKGVQAEVESFDNSGQALWDMNAYGIDMGILLPSFVGTHAEFYADICRRNRDRFRTCALDTETRLAAMRGTKKWNLDDSLKELDGYFTKDREIYVGIGEFPPGNMAVVRDRPTLRERFMEWCQIAEFCTHWDIPCYIHEFSPVNLEQPFSMLAQVCSKYPLFKLIIAHGGGNEKMAIEKACYMAQEFEHVYLETGYWKAEYYEFALRNPLIGASRLIWGGGDTGSRLWYPQVVHGAVLTESNRVYNNRNNWVWNGSRELDYNPNYYGWACHQIIRLLDLNLCTQDEIDLMVGGNAARIYKLPVPEEVTFCAGRPDLNIPPREILEAKTVTQRAGSAWPKDVDFLAGVNINI